MLRNIGIILALCIPAITFAFYVNSNWLDEFKTQLYQALQGNRKAQFQIGEMYEKERGTARQRSKEIALLGIA